MTPTIWLASTGFAVGFGPGGRARLFLPTFREASVLSATQVGLIASLGFLAFLVALPLTAWLGGRIGQRVPDMVGALLATALSAVSTGTTVGVAANLITIIF